MHVPEDSTEYTTWLELACLIVQYTTLENSTVNDTPLGVLPKKSSSALIRCDRTVPVVAQVGNLTMGISSAMLLSSHSKVLQISNA